MEFMVTSPKTVINLLMNNEMLDSKGEPYRLISLRDPSVQTDSQTSCYFYIRINFIHLYEAFCVN